MEGFVSIIDLGLADAAKNRVVCVGLVGFDKEDMGKGTLIKSARLRPGAELGVFEGLLNYSASEDVYVSAYCNERQAEALFEALAAKPAKQLAAGAPMRYKIYNMPGSYALLREEGEDSRNVIYIGMRKHDYSYKHVCCIPDIMAKMFLRDAAGSKGSGVFKKKNGEKLQCVSKAYDPELYGKWAAVMDDAYETAKESGLLVPYAKEASK